MNFQYRRIDQLLVRYATAGVKVGTPVLFTSPWPESIVAFRKLWTMLEGDAPLVGLDLPGFGHSEESAEVLNPQAMGNFILEFVDRMSLGRPHMVCPDVGTSAVLFAAARKSDAFTSITVGGGAMDEKNLAGTLKDIVYATDTSALERIDGAEIVAASIGRLLGEQPSEDDLRDYRESYAGTRFARSAAYVRSYPRYLPELRKLLPAIETPVQVVYGVADPLVPPQHAEVLAHSLPNVRVLPLDCGHFAWQDAAEDYGAALRAWLSGGYEALRSATASVRSTPK